MAGWSRRFGHSLASAFGPSAAPFWLRANHYGTLILSSALAIFLLIVVGLLIAFMQFQVRLLTAGPQMTSGRLIELAATERQSQIIVKELYAKRDELLKVQGEIARVRVYVRDEVGSLCTLLDKQFGAAPSGASLSMPRIEKCATFMQSVSSQIISCPAESGCPPDGQVTGAGSSAAAHDVVIALLSEMGQSQDYFGDKGVPSSYGQRIGRILALNGTFNATLQSTYQRTSFEYDAKCGNYNRLLQSVPYKDAARDRCVMSFEATLMPANASQVGGPAATRQVPDGENPSEAVALPAVAAAAGPVAATNTLDREKPTETERPRDAASAVVLAAGAPILSPGDGQRIFELVSDYMFYATLDTWLLGDERSFLKNMILSPVDYISILLVSACGFLGGIVNILFMNRRIGKDPTLRNVLIDPVQGVVCAMLLYIILRSGVLAIADNSGIRDVATLSPFFLAFVGVTAGLVAGHVIEVFHDRATGWVGRLSEGGDRWGIGLATAMTERNMDAEALGAVLAVNARTVEDWRDEKAAVPGRFQERIAAALRKSSRQLFTATPPVTV